MLTTTKRFPKAQTHRIKLTRNIYKDGWDSPLYFVAKLGVIPSITYNHYFGLAMSDREPGKPFLFGRAWVIDNHGGSAADAKRAGTVHINSGDILIIRGKRFRAVLQSDRRPYGSSVHFDLVPMRKRSK